MIGIILYYIYTISYYIILYRKYNYIILLSYYNYTYIYIYIPTDGGLKSHRWSGQKSREPAEHLGTWQEVHIHGVSAILVISCPKKTFRIEGEWCGVGGSIREYHCEQKTVPKNVTGVIMNT